MSSYNRNRNKEETRMKLPGRIGGEHLLALKRGGTSGKASLEIVDSWASWRKYFGAASSPEPLPLIFLFRNGLPRLVPFKGTFSVSSQRKGAGRNLVKL